MSSLNDSGFRLRVQVQDQDGDPVDLNDMDVLEVWYTSPSQLICRRRTALATSGGTDGWLHYDVPAGEITEEGEWEYQGHVEDTTATPPLSLTTQPPLTFPVGRIVA